LSDGCNHCRGGATRGMPSARSSATEEGTPSVLQWSPGGGGILPLLRREMKNVGRVNLIAELSTGDSHSVAFV